MNIKKFKENDIVLYTEPSNEKFDENTSLHQVKLNQKHEVGIVKSENNTKDGYFVWFNEGDTALNTKTEHLNIIVSLNMLTKSREHLNITNENKIDKLLAKHYNKE